MVNFKSLATTNSGSMGSNFLSCPPERGRALRLQFRPVRIETSCCSVKSSSVSLGTFTWSPLVIVSEPAPIPPPTPAPMAAPLPPPASAPIIDPTAAPPTVLLAVLAPLDLPDSSYSPVTMGIVCPFTTIPVNSSRSCDFPVNIPQLLRLRESAIDIGSLSDHHVTAHNQGFFE